MIEKIKTRIRVLGLKKMHVAKQIGICPVELSHYLNETRDMPLDVETKLKSYLGLS
jgi:hypothetical protein